MPAESGGILATALKELREQGSDELQRLYGVPMPKRPRTAESPGILGLALKEVSQTIEELKSDAERPDTRQGIIGKALEQLQHTSYQSKFQDRRMSLKRALSAEDITENRQGMIAKLLKTQDPEELEALGLTELMGTPPAHRKESIQKRPPDLNLNLNLGIGRFVPKQKSRESTASSDEGKSAHKARFKATERKFAGLEEEKDEKQPYRSSTIRRSKFKESHSRGVNGKEDRGSKGSASSTIEQKITAKRGKNHYASASSTDEMMDIDITMADPQTKALYLAKREDWTILENDLDNMPRGDYSMQDQHGFTPLLLAVRENKLAVFEKLLKKGADIMQTTKDHRNAAHIASMYAGLEMLDSILAKNRELLRKPAGPKKQLPIHVACERRSKKAYQIVRRLLDEIDQRLEADGEGSLPVHLALKSGNVSIVELLLSTSTGEQASSVDGNGDTLLHLACRAGSMDEVRVVIAAGCSDANLQNKAGRTPLHEVAAIGDQNLLKIMFKLHADANMHDKDDRTPVHVAAEKGHTSSVEVLIDKFGGSIRARTRDGSTLLHIAACSGHTSTALAFLKRGVPLFMPNKKGALGLHSAAAAGFNDVVKMLIAKGTSVDVRTKDNYTALHVAVMSGKASVVETLLGAGADVHVRGGELGQTALHIAASLDGPESRECAMMLLKSGGQPDVAQEDGETCLHIAARNGNKEIMKLMLNENANAQIKSNSGETPLHVCAKSCNFEAAQMILNHLSEKLSPEELKEYVNQRDNSGFTAIHYAAEITANMIHYPGEDAKLVNLLVDYGGQVELQSLNTNETAMHMAARSGNQAVLLAMVNKIGAGAVQIVQNKQSKNGWSPLLEACSRGHTEVAKILLQHHARIDVFDDQGRTALHLAALNGHLPIVHLLLQHKAFVNSKSKTGEAPLHLCAMNGHVKVVNVLVQDHGASLEAITLENQTALHFAAKYGQLAVSQTLLALGANPNARDDKGQTPLHLSAENDYPDVVKLFLKMKQNNRAVLTAIDHNGFTCAHIAAMKGSLAVVKELMMIDKAMVIQAKTKTMEATTLHMAAAGGHANIVKILLENGANPEDENAHGMTALHLGAKNGYVSILEAFDKGLWRRCSRKTGLNALHIAAYYGNSDFVNEMLKHVPASIRSEPPIYNHHVVKEFATEYGFTPLHLASQSGHDSLVRMLLNQGVQVDATSTTMDWRGRTPLHLAAQNGHYEMVSLLIAQGSNINVMDQVPLCFAAANNHIECLRYLLQQKHDTHLLMEDRKFVFDLMICGKGNDNEPLQEFILQSPAPIDTAVKLSALYRDMSEKEKERAKDLSNVAVFSESMAVELLGIAASEYNAAMLLKAKDNRGRPLLDVLIENQQKEVVSYASVQRYLTEIWTARVDWSFGITEKKKFIEESSFSGKTLAFSLLVFMCPPAWFYFSLPLDSRIGRAPIIKFVCHIVSHVYFVILLTVVVLNITHKMYKFI
ncbi:hypothetical protein WR25_08242 isoform C [Diploscapter pachys]|uniref:Uncharacterized protein n=1 Tax=Diploscapter pachys TaxID=2018661 RepID=A0A2A2LHQ1_9BILA|nr:hypothetical protein WR25_08242 isoform B [Diploscapter pachys]PAV85628.1 hypothetical protein WR25_08242 isoform C [Diploscapter pachys]